MRGARVAAGLGVIGGLTALVGARVEAEAFVLRRVTAPVLAPGQRPLRLLQVSDLHLTPGNRRRVAWTQGLAALEPDLVIDSGDNLAHVDAVETTLEALGPLLDFPGVFVHGSNDYYGPRAKNPFGYFGGPSLIRKGAPRLPTDDLTAGLTAAGWLDLNNRRDSLEVAGQRIRLVGMDDPHIRRDRMPAPADHPSQPSELRLGLVHAPYLHALHALAADGSDLILAGHTHGGQVCLPWTALVTNCDLPVRYAKGLHLWPDETAPERDPWLHVSAGLGTNPYAPLRLFCRPEATLLTLVARG